MYMHVLRNFRVFLGPAATSRDRTATLTVGGTSSMGFPISVLQ